MKSTLVCSLACAVPVLFAATGAWAQSVDEIRNVTINAIGEAEAPADYAAISFTLRGEGETSEAARQALFNLRRMIEDVYRADVASGDIEFNGSGFNVDEVREPTCVRAQREARGSEERCAVIGYEAEIYMRADVRPPPEAGNVLARVNQLGAINPRFAHGGVDDEEALTLDAIADAVVNARAMAERIADAGGFRLGPVHSVRVSARSSGVVRLANVANAAYAGSPGDDAITGDAPDFDYSLRVPPVETRQEVNVVFGILP